MNLRVLVTLSLTTTALLLSDRMRAAVADLPSPAENRAVADIRAVLDAQAAAWNRGDIDAYMDGYERADSTTFISGDKVTRGWQTVRDVYKNKYNNREKMGTLSFSEIAVSQLGNDAALVTGRWALAREDDQPHGRFTLLFRRTAAGWRIVHDHTSSATP